MEITTSKIFILFLLLHLIILNLFALEQSNLKKVTLQLQWKHQFEFAGFYAAKEKGFYKDVGLDVEFKEFTSNMNIVDEVLKGKADYGLTYSSLIAEYMQGKPLIFIANFFKQSPLVLVTQKDIRTPSDLKNKKIMGLLDSSHKQIILTMLDKFNMTIDDFTNIERKFSIESFINKEVDAVSVFTTNEIYTLEKRGIQYNILDPAAFGTKFYDINLFTSKSEFQKNPKRVDDFRRASIKGWEYALKHKEELANLIIKKYNTQKKGKEALLFEAKQIEYLMLSNIYPIGDIDLERVQMIADNFAQSLFIPKESKEKLEQFIYKTKGNTLQLNAKQKQYLKDKKIIKMCTDPNWMPLEKVEDGKHIGLAADFLALISQKINTPMELVVTQNWAQSLNKIKSRECDILTLAEKTPSRTMYLNFTTPYVQMSLVIVTKKGQPFIDNLNHIKKKPLGIVKNYSKYELLKAKYPNINLVEVDSIQEGLEFVEQEKIFGYLDNALVINNEIQKNKMNDTIVISGQFPETSYLSIASRNDEPLLGDIIEKALLSVNSDTKDNLISKWKNINYQIQTDYQLLLRLLFFTFVPISIFIYWNLKLKEVIKSKELAQKQLKISEEKFRTLFDIAPVLLNAFDKNGKIILWNKECEKVFGWSKEELVLSKNPIVLFYPDSKQKFIDSVSQENHNIFKQWNPKTKKGEILTTMWANIKLPNNEIIHIGHDITQQRKNELVIEEKTKQLNLAKKQLEKLNDSLEKRVQDEIQANTKHQVMLMQQSKLVQMGEMIENIAHQWRQPLAQINSAVLLVDAALIKNKLENNIIEEKLSEIEYLTKYMSNTIDDFRNFFHPNKQKSTFFIKEAIEKSYNIVKGRMHSHYINISIDVREDFECYGYFEELQQVILILLNNAIEALVFMQVKSPKIFVTVHAHENDLLLDIEDNALGIESKLLDKIFEPYFTTKHQSQGTGLGLYMAKMIVENALNGKLSVSNKLDGACFTIEVPKRQSAI